MVCTTNQAGKCMYSNPGRMYSNKMCNRKLTAAGQKAVCVDKSSFLNPTLDLENMPYDKVMTILTTMTLQLAKTKMEKKNEMYGRPRAKKILQAAFGLNFDFTQVDAFAELQSSVPATKTRGAEHAAVLTQVHGILNMFQNALSGAANKRRLGGTTQRRLAGGFNLAKSFTASVAKKSCESGPDPCSPSAHASAYSGSCARQNPVSHPHGYAIAHSGWPSRQGGESRSLKICRSPHHRECRHG
jgi:hypothetical protein